jgi:beta-N-acetylglucosaminidase
MFPMYDEIISKLDGTELCLNEEHCATITRLGQEHINNIYLIILHSYLLTNPTKSDLPYGGKTISNGKGINFKKLDQIPESVQKIIYRYLKLVSTQ